MEGHGFICELTYQTGLLKCLTCYTLGRKYEEVKSRLYKLIQLKQMSFSLMYIHVDG